MKKRGCNEIEFFNSPFSYGSFFNVKEDIFHMNRPPKVGPKNLTLGGRFFMVKYSTEFKLKVVTAYLNGEDSYKKLVP
ncbi:hypothetical protein, partial [Megasphaera massiliensis]|uniref:hypothetical protein n=1 Tax=Megasphaera massiliensis TaxID=1232428 RepID=UPI003AEFDBC3